MLLISRNWDTSNKCFFPYLYLTIEISERLRDGSTSFSARILHQNMCLPMFVYVSFLPSISTHLKTSICIFCDSVYHRSGATFGNDDWIPRTPTLDTKVVEWSQDTHPLQMAAGGTPRYPKYDNELRRVFYFLGFLYMLESLGGFYLFQNCKLRFPDIFRYCLEHFWNFQTCDRIWPLAPLIYHQSTSNIQENSKHV